MVAYNYFDSSPKRPVWTVGSLARTMWEDSAVFGSPHALEYTAGNDSSFDVVGNTEGRTIYYEHETGTDQVKGGATTAIVATPCPCRVMSKSPEDMFASIAVVAPPLT